MIDIHISKNIRHLRKSRGLTQSDISELLGVTQTQVGRYESGKNAPSFENLLQLQQYFSVNLHHFVYVDLSLYPDGKVPEKKKQPDPKAERIIARLNRRIDDLAEDIIRRADPGDLEKLKQLREEYIDRFPDIAEELGIKK